MKTIAIVDVETTGLDPFLHDVIEVACVLYDVERRAIVQQMSTVLPCQDNPAQHINGIEPAMTQIGSGFRDAALAILTVIVKSNYVVAFNSSFDSQWFKAPLPTVPEHLWVDAALMPWQHHLAQPSLVALCVGYGIPIVRAHRALDDCVLLAELIGKLPDIEEAIAYARAPRLTLKAVVTYEQKDLAKEAGFVWDRIVPRAWAKVVHSAEVEEFVKALPFESVAV